MVSVLGTRHDAVSRGQVSPGAQHDSDLQLVKQPDEGGDSVAGAAVSTVTGPEPQPVGEIDLSEMRVTVQHSFDAPVERTWQVVSDLPLMAGFSPEVQELSWDDDARTSFTATNERGGRRWTITGFVTERHAPLLLRWTVSDPARPSSTWSNQLSPHSGARTLVVHTFAHGPGNSLVRQMVQQDLSAKASVLDWRRRMLEADMSASLRAAAEILR